MRGRLHRLPVAIRKDFGVGFERRVGLVMIDELLDSVPVGEGTSGRTGHPVVRFKYKAAFDRSRAVSDPMRLPCRLRAVR